jgi:hypothetical protein
VGSGLLPSLFPSCWFKFQISLSSHNSHVPIHLFSVPSYSFLMILIHTCISCDLFFFFFLFY